MEKHGSARGYVDAPADLVFATITDLARLPAWNRRMTGVVELPAELAVGAEWVVGFRIGGRRFNSRSVVEELDRRRRRFVHRSKPDDDNPSCTVWTWEVEPEGPGSRVTVRWDLQPLTRGRRLLAAPFRGWQIPRHDIPASLAALARVCEADAAGSERIGR
jgi:uncharacterized protein YndB with AHSA1/START domain